ncbi:MAG: thioesterase [Clostridiaceae bacterium]|nr:thioesterase [Clostridiaceae bacterium]
MTESESINTVKPAPEWRPDYSASPMGPYSFSIRGTDTDDHDRLHLFALFACMQEAAYHNAKALQAGSDDFDARGLCWLLIKISVQMEHLPHWGEILTIDTWQQGVQKLVFIRNFLFYDQTGRKLGEATSEWLIASQDTHRPQRPDHVWPEGLYPAPDRQALSFNCPKLLKLDQPDLAPILVKYADFSDIDRNHHVNNTRYVAWCLDAIYAAALQKAQNDDSRETPGEESGGYGRAGLVIRQFDIHYINEVRVGTKLYLYGMPDDREKNCWQVEARRAADDVRIFRAQVRIDPE